MPTTSSTAAPSKTLSDTTTDTPPSQLTTQQPLPTWVERLKQHGLGRALLMFVLVLVPFILANAITKLTLVGDDWLHIRNACKVLVLAAAYWAYVRYIEQRPVTELAGTGAITELLRGVAIATLLISAPVLLLWSGGWFTIQGVTLPSSLLHLALGFFSVAVLEELLFRAVLFRLFEQSLGSVWALVLSSVLFSAVHGLNPHADILSTVQLLILGLLFIAAFLATRRLWLCIGLHWGWNFAQGGLFSSPVSGMKAEGIVQSSVTGPVWLTGGDFGIEASVLASIGAALYGIWLLRQAQQQQHLRARPAPVSDSVTR